MPLVTCPRCSASIFAIAVGNTVVAMGTTNLEYCKDWTGGAGKKSSIDLLVECSVMERAVEAALKIPTKGPGSLTEALPETPAVEAAVTAIETLTEEQATEVTIASTVEAATATLAESVAESCTENQTVVTWVGDSRGKRLYERWELLEGALIFEGQRQPCILLNISPGGAAIWTAGSLEVAIGTEVWMDLSDHGALPAEVVRMNGRVLGVMFLLGVEQRDALTERLVGLRNAVAAQR